MHSNPVFKNLKVTTDVYRNKLPRIQDPNENIHIWSLIKNLIGKDLSKIAVPGINNVIFEVQLNEPLSML